MLKKVKIEDAVGLRLAHDLTKIVPGKFKGAAFFKGHRVKPEDLPQLLDMGKKQIYVLTLGREEVHEDEAARRIGRAAAGPGIRLEGPREGKVNFLAKSQGLLKVNVNALQKINATRMLIFSTRHSNSVVGPGENVAGTRAIPLTLKEAVVRKVEEICRRAGPIIRILPLHKKKVGILVTGSEIYEKRIRDHSSSRVQKKVQAFGSTVICKAIVPDDAGRIALEIQKMKAAGCHVIVTTGGLSVDPDDMTLEGIQRAGAKILCYGVPVLPGSMSVYARLGDTTILGAPACIVHDSTTTFDLFLPRALADNPVSREEVARLGHGGFCLKCRICRYPICPYGKG